MLFDELGLSQSNISEEFLVRLFQVVTVSDTSELHTLKSEKSRNIIPGNRIIYDMDNDGVITTLHDNPLYYDEYYRLITSKLEKGIEKRVLSIPPLKIESIWYNDLVDDSKDYFIPYLSLIPSLEVGKAYPKKEFVDQIVQARDETIKQYVQSRDRDLMGG